MRSLVFVERKIRAYEPNLDIRFACGSLCTGSFEILALAVKV